MTIENQNIHGNRKHKDALFCRVFSKKKDLLDLYNAVNGTDYQNEDDLEVNTLDNVLYMTMKNDVSFIVDCTMNLYEHQSTENPNMPLRGLFYFAKLYTKYVEQQRINLYSSTVQKIPTPKYVIFYNGLESEPDCQMLRLSELFFTKGGCLECEATMLNINYGRNRDLMEKCRRLQEYAKFIDAVRGYAIGKGMDLGMAITLAMEDCIRDSILLDILTEQRSEVFSVILERFDKELYERDLVKDLTTRIEQKVTARITEEVTAKVTEEVTAKVTEQVTEEVTAKVTEQVTEEVTAKVTEQVTEEVTAKVTEQVTEEVTAKVTEEVTAKVTEEVTAKNRQTYLTEGAYLKLKEQVEKKYNRGLSVEEIAEQLEEDEDVIRKMIN